MRALPFFNRTCYVPIGSTPADTRAWREHLQPLQCSSLSLLPPFAQVSRATSHAAHTTLSMIDRMLDTQVTLFHPGKAGHL